jgi:hypothetical protein
MAQMDKVTQQNAANAEESASASEELSAQAEQMNQIVAQLSVLVGGSGPGRTASAAKETVRHLNLNTTVDHEAARKTHESASKQHGLGQADHVFHNIADSSKAKQEQTTTTVTRTPAEKAIPLDEDDSSSSDDFKDFNG